MRVLNVETHPYVYIYIYGFIYTVHIYINTRVVWSCCAEMRKCPKIHQKCQDTSRASLSFQLIASFYCSVRKYTAHSSCVIMKFMHMHHAGFITSWLESSLGSVCFPDQTVHPTKKTRKVTRAPVRSMPALPPWQNSRRTAPMPKWSSYHVAEQAYMPGINS